MTFVFLDKDPSFSSVIVKLDNVLKEFSEQKKGTGIMRRKEILIIGRFSVCFPCSNGIVNLDGNLCFLFN